MLIDEHQYVIELPERAVILQRLVDGINEATLSDDEFDQIEYLNDKGYLSIIDSEDAPAWELVGVQHSTLQNQQKHLTFSIVDSTVNNVGADIANRLESFGFSRDDDDSKLIIAFADSYLKLPEGISKPILPVICNRMKLWLGPIQFPWSANIVDKIKQNEAYMVEPRYVLPKVFDELQRAWVAAALSQMFTRSQLRYVGCYYEYNMTVMRSRIIPIE